MFDFPSSPFSHSFNRRLVLAAIFCTIVTVIGVQHSVAAPNDLNQPGSPKNDSKPNFVFMLSDDQAWNGLSVQMQPNNSASKSGIVQTPTLEKLAAAGMRFSAAYAPAPVCAPTRISLQTGKSPAQVHWTKAGPSVNDRLGYKLSVPKSIRNLSTSETTIAEMLKTVGYRTAHFGKWHLSGGGPGKHGYDVHDGNLGNEHAAKFKDPNPVDIFGMAERADAFFKACAVKQKPFYCQLS